MATRKKASSRKAAKETALTNYDAAFAEQAEAAAKQEAHVGGGQFLSTSGGTLKFDGAPVPGNHIPVVIIDNVLANTYYEERYDSDNPTPPTCYAFARDVDEMAPHEEVSDKQSDDCNSCSMNEYGSAEYGRGKACANRRRLAVIPAGTLDESGNYDPYVPEELEDGEVVYLAVPPTSIKGFAAYVKKLAATTKRPPHGVVTKIAVVPDTKTQFKLTFSLLELVQGEGAKIVIDRNKIEQDNTAFPYPKAEVEETEKKPAKKKTKKTRGRRKVGF